MSPSRLLPVLLALVPVLAAPGDAQERTPRAGYTAFAATGMSRIATQQLDQRLAASGHPTFGRRPVAINVGGYRLLRSGLMLGGEWHYLLLGDGHETHLGREVGLGAGYATLGIAYAVDRGTRLRVYPRLGLGVGGMGLWTEADADGADDRSDFGEWLADPNYDPAYSTLSQASMVVDVGAGAELLLRAQDGGPLVGVRLGYVATPFDQGWTRHGRSIDGAPHATVAGPYVRVLMGWRRERSQSTNP